MDNNEILKGIGSGSADQQRSTKSRPVLLISLVSLLILAGAAAELWLRLGGTSLSPGSGLNNAFITGYCGLRGGTLVSSGCGLGGCNQRCVFPYRDAGRSCTNSGQCGGRCLVVSPQMPDAQSAMLRPAETMKSIGCAAGPGGWWTCPGRTIVGRCETQPAGNCSQDWELQDGLVKPQLSACTI